MMLFEDFDTNNQFSSSFGREEGAYIPSEERMGSNPEKLTLNCIIHHVRPPY